MIKRRNQISFKIPIKGGNQTLEQDNLIGIDTALSIHQRPNFVSRYQQYPNQRNRVEWETIGKVILLIIPWALLIGLLWFLFSFCFLHIHLNFCLWLLLDQHDSVESTTMFLVARANGDSQDYIRYTSSRQNVSYKSMPLLSCIFCNRWRIKHFRKMAIHGKACKWQRLMGHFPLYGTW